ncbi:MAG: asparagine synthase (glutamine-hydrolyzing) [Planctomycetaceae bacterium]
MCGIAGAAWSDRGEPISAAVLARMTDVLAHRGPDDRGFYQSHGADSTATIVRPGAALGHRRLSIIDLGGGRQPLSNEDGTIWIVFNGEIYNYKELRGPLEAKGHRFQTESDTETIVHLYEEYGDECVDFLRGMFAFAIWDENKQRLFLARDRLGKKPLVVRFDERRLIFASELKSLLQIPDAPRTLNPRAVDYFLTYQYVPHPHSILEGYHKIPPGHCAIYERGEFKIRRYWSPPYDEPNRNSPQSPEEWRRQLRETVTDAVRLRMRSDVPLGAFLSGGIDSTIISGLMQQLSERPVHTFSIGFPVKQFDETSYAREAAKHLGTEHHEMTVEPDALSILPKLIWHYDEPFADSSAIPMMYLAEMTRREVTVALSGDGGDELFAGYDRYRAVRLGVAIDQWPRPLRAILTSRIWQMIPASVQQKSFRRRVKRLLAELGKPPERRYLRWISIFDAERRHDLYSNSFRAQLGEVDSADILLDAYASCPNRDFVTRTSCADVLTYLPCDILTKVDIATMAASLEARCPFLDHEVAELAARMPIELKQTPQQGKKILLETFSDLLPVSIQRRAKMGFGVPLDHWFRGPLKALLHDALFDRKAVERGYFNPAVVRRLFDEHIAGKWDHSYRLWALLCFEMWHRMYLDTAHAPAAPPTSF